MSVDIANAVFGLISGALFGFAAALWVSCRQTIRETEDLYKRVMPTAVAPRPS